MNTEPLVKQLRQLNPAGPITNGLLLEAADRIEHLGKMVWDIAKQRDEERAERKRLSEQLEDSTNYYNRLHDLLRGDVERLKQELHDAGIENSGQAAQLERTRPAPSRLEIAAMIFSSAWSFAREWGPNHAATAVKAADQLIAAAKEEGAK